MNRSLISIATIITLTASAFAASPIKVKTDNGEVIAGSNSYMTLYTYSRDEGGVPSCYDECAKNWPPHLAEYWDSPRAPFATADRKDGKKQWTLHGKPLYFSIRDRKKGETNGDGVDGLWTVARPE